MLVGMDTGDTFSLICDECRNVVKHVTFCVSLTTPDAFGPDGCL